MPQRRKLRSQKLRFWAFGRTKNVVQRYNKKGKDAQLGRRGQSARGRSPAAWEGKEGGLQHRNVEKTEM